MTLSKLTFYEINELLNMVDCLGSIVKNYSHVSDKVPELIKSIEATKLKLNQEFDIRVKSKYK